MSTPLFDLPERRTANVIARDALRHAIVSGALPHGARITLAQMAEQLGTSVTPVREALRDLSAEGLVDLDAHRGAWVHSPTPREMAETYRLRQVLEPIAMSDVAKLPLEVKRASLDEAAQLHEAMLVESDYTEFAEINRHFHAHLTEPLRKASPRLHSMVETLRNMSMAPVVTALRQVGSMKEDACCDHATMLEALHDGDAERAGQVTLTHLARTQSILDLD